MLLNLPYILLTVLGIGFIIFVHELGHFLAARAVGVRVEAFSIGFGPRLWGFRRGTTDYKLCLIPLGGYVKMAGEDPTRPTTGDPEEFGSKKVWQRMIVISAGVIMNMLFALVAIPIAFAFGIPFQAPVIGGVSPGGPAWEAGLAPGDRIVQIDGRRVLEFSDIPHDLAVASGPSRLTIERDGRTFDVVVQGREDSELGLRLIGVIPQIERVVVSEEVFESDDPDQAAVAAAYRAAGLGPEDVVVGIEGFPAGSLAGEIALRHLIDVERSTSFQVRRNGAIETVEVAPVMKAPEEDEAWWLGVEALRNTVKKVRPDTPAARSGLRPGDVIVAVNGTPLVEGAGYEELVGAGKHPWSYVDEPVPPAEQRYPDPNVALTVRRGSTEEQLVCELPTRADRIAFLNDVAFEPPPKLLVRVRPGSAAEKGGLRSGDVIVSIGGKALEDGWETLLETVRSSEGEPIRIGVDRGDSSTEVLVTPERQRRNLALLGIVSFPAVDRVELSFSEALPAGLTYTWRMVQRIVDTLRSIVTGTVHSKNLGGVISIFQASMIYSRAGLMRALLFLAMVSINLAIINILPIPVLDGGWLLFLIIEKIKGSPISERAMGYFQWAGLAFIVGLMLYVTWNDLSRLFGWM